MTYLHQFFTNEQIESFLLKKGFNLVLVETYEIKRQYPGAMSEISFLPLLLAIKNDQELENITERDGRIETDKAIHFLYKNVFDLEMAQHLVDTTISQQTFKDNKVLSGPPSKRSTNL